MAKNWELEYRRCGERCENIDPIPEDFYDWGKTLFSDLKWMTYKKHGAYADLFCCACGHEETVKIKRGQSYEAQMAEHVFDMPARNEIGTCPWCGEKVVFKAGIRSDHVKKEIAWIGQSYQKSSYVLRYVEIMEEWGKGRKVKYTFLETARIFYIAGRRTIKKDYLLHDYMRGCVAWCPHNVGGFGNYITKRGHIYPGTYEAMKGTAVEYSMAREYVWKRYHLPVYRNGEWYWNIEWYLSQYWRYPILEMLIKTGAENLTEEVVHNWENHLKLNKRAKTPWDVLGIAKARLKYLIQKDSTVAWNWYRYEREKGIRLDDDLIEWYRREGIQPYMLKEVMDHIPMTLLQIKNYLEKQSGMMNACHGQGTRITSMLGTWKDYLAMMKQQGHDLSDAIVYRPKDLEQAHARAVAESERKNVEEAVKEYYEKFPNVKGIMKKAAKRYAYWNDRYIMVIPEGIEDVLIEGKTLHHCISASDRYIGRMAAGETYIGFVRRAERPDVPFYSVEFEPGGTVRQKRTYYNRHDEYLDDVVEFLREWQEWVRKTMTPEEKRKAKISERRRREDMEAFYKSDPVFAKATEEDLLVNSNVPPQIMLDVSRYTLDGAGRIGNSEAGQQALMPAV